MIGKVCRRTTYRTGLLLFLLRLCRHLQEAFPCYREVLPAFRLNILGSELESTGTNLSERRMKWKRRTLNDSIYGTCFLAKAAIDTFSHVDIFRKLSKLFEKREQVYHIWWFFESHPPAPRSQS